MLVEPQPTPYDLKFRLFRFPVRVHPLFWLFTALIGADFLRAGPVAFLVWMAVAFVSILVHELGHAVAYRRFGAESHIVLYAFGGLAVPWSGVAGRWRRVVVYLAGPGAGFLLFAAVYFSNEAYPWAQQALPLGLLYLFLFWTNLVWGLFNLLPVFPLDGGQVCREACEAASRRNGFRVALQVSMGTAGLLAIYGLIGATDKHADLLGFLPWWVPRGSLWTAILFGVLAFQSYQLLQQFDRLPGRWHDPDDDRPPWRS